MSNKKNSSEPEIEVAPMVSEATRLEMEAGRRMASINALNFAHAEASRISEDKAKAEKEVADKLKQAEDKLQAVADAEEAHRNRHQSSV